MYCFVEITDFFGGLPEVSSYLLFCMCMGVFLFCRLYERAVLGFRCKESVKRLYINKFSVVVVVGHVGFVENLLFRLKMPVF